MTNRLPTNDVPSSDRATSEGFLSRCCSALSGRLWPWLVLLALWAGVDAARAGNAVVTFTNFPSIVSNTYNGVITLQINGLTNGVTNVVVQKFLDANTNGIIDAGDLLVQQFQLTVGQAATFTNGSTTVIVTNFMPGDMTTSVTGQITAPLNFQNGDFAQTLVGQYLYKVSSPSGQFAPVTSLFVVTNSFFTTLVTGMVENASSFNPVTNAIVLLFSEPNLNVQAGTVANINGQFSIRTPPGDYLFVAAKSNYVANFDGTSINLTANETNNNNVILDLTPATTNIIGKALNAVTNSIGVPGLTGLAESTNDLISLYFTDTNGNFIAPVTNNSWAAPLDPFAAAFEGYLAPPTNQFFNVSNNLVNITNLLPQATAIFYGTVTNSSGGPVVGLYLEAADNVGHESWAMTDQHGNYVLDALGGTNEWSLLIPTTQNPGLTNNYVFSPGYIQTNINTGQAIQENFTLRLAPYTISGFVKDVNGDPISGVEVFATATNLNGLNYEAFDSQTAANGSYSLQVSPNVWTVGVTAGSLESLGYTNLPPTQSTNLTGGANATINFTILLCGEIQILTTNLPSAMVGSYYSTNLEADSCQNIANWSTAYGITLTSLFDTNVTYPAGTPIYSSGLVGYLFSYFAYGLTSSGGVNIYETNITAGLDESHEGEIIFTNINAVVDISGPIATNNTTVEINNKFWTASATTLISNGVYQTTLFLAQDTYKADNPKVYTASPGMQVTNYYGGPTTVVGSLTVPFKGLSTPGTIVSLPSGIAYNGSNNAVVWLPNGANLGQYFISAVGPQSTNLPPGLTLYPNGLLAGTPTGTGTNGGTFNFTVAVEDTASNTAVQPLTLFVYPATTLSAPMLSLSSSLFQMQINGIATGLDYTVQMTTNLASTNWTSIYTTNASVTNALVIPDPNATNAARFYRVLIGP